MKLIKEIKLRIQNVRVPLKVKIYLGFLLALVIFYVIFALFKVVSHWSDYNKIVFYSVLEFKSTDLGSQVNLNKPFEVKERQAQQVLVPVTVGGSIQPKETITEKAKEDIVTESRLSGLVDAIWNLESTRGQAGSGHHKYCESIGMTNEFGYGALDKVCFNTFKESVDAVTTWLEKNLESKPISETLCFYNKGTNERNCDYYINYRRLVLANLSK